jgi:hypothetical protein
MLDAITPPKARAPAFPLNVVVPAPLVPPLTRNVVGEVDPAATRCLKLMVIGELALGEICVPAANAPVPESRNKAAAMAVVPTKLLDKTMHTSISKMLDASVGVIASVMYSFPSVIWGMVSSNGIGVVPVSKAPVCV